MATQVNLRSKVQILGDLVRRFSVDSDITNFNQGGDIVTLFEAISESISQVEVSALKILESIDLSSLVGTALDKKALSIRLPNNQGGFGRKPSTQASGPVVIGSGFSKISSKLYSGKPAPFAGSFTLNVEDASGFPATGSIYIGRGTLNRFEGAIPYSAIVSNGSFWTITLSSPLTKNHLQADLVTFAQGGDRVVPAGTVVQTPSNSGSPAINYTTTQDLLIPDGEDEGSVNVICSSFGDTGNALLNAINSYASPPFAGATVRNSTTFRNGQPSENDEDLRQRIQDYPFTLSRGTDRAIQSAIQGLVDPSSGRSVQSSVVLPPVEPGDFARVFIDDGTGLEPSIEEQPYELLLKLASGVETRHKTTQRPIISVTAEGSETGPFVLTSGMTLQMQVDEITEFYIITPTNYRNLSSATSYEIVRDLNSQSNIAGFRTVDDGARIVAIDLSGEAESMQITSGDWQKAIGFPTSELRTMFLYKNSELLSFRGKTASIETRARNLWSLTAADLTDVRVRVDQVTQTFSVTDADFAEFDSIISNATISEWATVLSRKVAGIKFVASGQILVWSTHNSFSPTGQVEILETKADGTPAGWVGDDKMWLSSVSGGVLADSGAVKDYNFNRFTGELNLLTKPDSGSTLEIATADTRAFTRTQVSETGLYSIDPSVSTVGNSKLILGFDGTFALRDVSVAPAATLVPTEPDPVAAAQIIRLTANDVGLFVNSVVGDYMYLLPDQEALSTILPDDAEGLYRILARGHNTRASDSVVSALVGNSTVVSSIPVTTVLDSDLVTVAITDHGFSSGDLLTVATASPIGGIAAIDLSQVDAIITVIDENRFTYQAGAAATADSAGNLDTVGSNVIKITLTAHGLQTGEIADVSVTTGFGGISSGDLTVAGATIDVIDVNTYSYRASSAATSSAVGTITTVTNLANSWVEFEVSSNDYAAAWSAMLSGTFGATLNMLHLFKSEGSIPQIVDFGNAVSSETVDTIVESINSQVSGGSAVKFTPQQMEVRSNDFTSSGTIGVLAVIGTAVSLFPNPVISTAIQSHIASSKSKPVSGSSPVITGISTPTTSVLGYPTRTYLEVERNITNVTTLGANPTIESPLTYHASYPKGFQQLWLTGKNSEFTGRVYNNQITAPYTGVMTADNAITAPGTSDATQTSGTNLDRYSNIGIRLQDLPVNDKDSLIIEMDLDPVDKTVASPMAKLATILDMDNITGSGAGQVISFRISDPEDGDLAFFDSTSVYKDFDFADFKILTRSVGLYRQDASDRALIIRSADYGGNAKLRFSIRPPSQPNQLETTVTHTTNFLNDLARLNLIATLPSGPLVPSSAMGSGKFSVTPTASGTLFDWRISSPLLNSGSGYIAGNILNIDGAIPVAGSYQITSTAGGVFAGSSAATSIGSNIVTVTQSLHGLQTGDLITVLAAAPIGGITAVQLSVSEASVTVIGPSTFSYTTVVSATSTDTGSLTTVSAGVVIVKAPGDAGISGSTIYDAATAPITTFPIVDQTFEDMADSINTYSVTNPIASAEAVGTDLATNPITGPTYSLYPASTAYTGSDMSGAFSHHSFECKLSGSAGIWQYDSSVLNNNGIKATVQSSDSIFPTVTEASGTIYSPIGELVQIVPTNTKSLAEWINFRAVSSLNILANVDRTNNDSKVQISSKEIGSAGAIAVTGVSANGVEGAVLGNASNVDDSTRITALSASVQSMIPGQIVKVQNNISSEILRAYRDTPTGVSETLANTTDINSYFRAETSIKYVRVDANTGRLIFFRNGMNASQDEPIIAGDEITLTDLGSGLVQVGLTAGTGKLSARTGDMMYVQPGSGFGIDVRCKPIPGNTSPVLPEYLGYPVVHVIDDVTVVVLAPNITTGFGATTLGDDGDGFSRELVFIPAIYNEKNIRTNHQEGAKFDLLHADGKAYYLVKSLGNGVMSMFLQNSATEAGDDMLLDNMSVDTDDLLVLGDGFSPANQGSHKIVAHNGRNHVIFFNEGGGLDELIDLNGLTNGGQGDRKWRVGPLDDGAARSVRVISSDSAKIGDKLRISTPPSTTQWFNDVFFGSWDIVGLGYQAYDYSAFPLPHDSGDGAYDQNFFAPYVDFSIPNAPVSVLDENNAEVDTFLTGDNVSAIGFTEGAPFSGYRMISGHAVSSQSIENRDVFLRPKKDTSKMSTTFGTQIVGLAKIGFEERTFSGVDGYKVYGGLVREAHRVIDGLPENTIVNPGVKAAGTVIEVQTPLIKSIQVSLQVRPTDGVTLNSISELVKSAAAEYIKGLGEGRPVVISEIVRTVQALPGVFSVSVLSTLPAAEDDRIVVSEQEKAFVLDVSADVTVG